jgi:hypothetical protein
MPPAANTPPRRPHPHHGAHLLAAAVVAFVVALLYRGDESPDRSEPQVAPPPAVAPAEANPWRAAARLVEEDRHEPTGRKAAVRVPPQLQHYADRRRFLGIQVAAWREQGYELPHDDAELAQMIDRGELVEVPPVGADYVLYGVGANATGEPLVHLDRATGQEVPLYPRYDVYEDDDHARQAAIEETQAALKDAQARLAKTPRAQRKARAALARDIKALRAEVAAKSAARKRLAAWYDDYDRRKLLVSEWQTLDALAGRLSGKRRYDLTRTEDRRAFRGRLLSFLRPAARDLVLEAARAYRSEFSRPLPVTSLVRTEQYQRQLGETNPNATRIAAPPHTTGLAFDVYYKYMTRAEQESLMGWIGRLESEGRLEALRENRDHIHVFALPEGRPSETLIAQAMDVVTGGRWPRATPAGRRTAVADRAPARTSAARAARRQASAVRAPSRTPAKKASAPVKRPARRSRTPRR